MHIKPVKTFEHLATAAALEGTGKNKGVCARRIKPFSHQQLDATSHAGCFLSFSAGTRNRHLSSLL
jgi:hypothetical protein